MVECEDKFLIALLGISSLEEITKISNFDYEQAMDLQIYISQTKQLNEIINLRNLNGL
jgi:hypothetical protein